MIKKILTDKEISISEKVVLAYLVYIMDSENKVEATHEEISKSLSISRTTIIKALGNLSKNGIVEKKNNFHNGIIIANSYKINLSKYN